MFVSWVRHPGQGPHLLLIHGFLCSRAQWGLNLDALAEVCQPVTVELLGHNESAAPESTESYHPDAYVDVFEEIRKTLAVDRWFVFGYSLGAGLALRYALTHPDRIIGHGFSNSTSALADEERLAEWRQSAPEAAAKIIAGGREAMEQIVVHPKRAIRLPTPLYQALVADARKHSPLGIANTMRYTNPLASMRTRVSENTRPALLVWGTRERRFRPFAEFAIERCPMLTVAQLQAGHGVNMEAADEFNDTIARFIKGCASE